MCCALYYSDVVATMCVGVAVLICCTANRWWVWCFPCLSDHNQSAEEKLSHYVTHDVPKVTSQINSITTSVNIGDIFVFFFLYLALWAMMHSPKEILTIVFSWTNRGVEASHCSTPSLQSSCQFPAFLCFLMFPSSQCSKVFHFDDFFLSTDNKQTNHFRLIENATAKILRHAIF